jgi:hypothetical protein
MWFACINPRRFFLVAVHSRCLWASAPMEGLATQHCSFDTTLTENQDYVDAHWGCVEDGVAMPEVLAIGKALGKNALLHRAEFLSGLENEPHQVDGGCNSTFTRHLIEH